MQSARQAGTVIAVVWQGIVPAADQNPNDYPTLIIYSYGEDWKRVSTIHDSVHTEKSVATMEAGTVREGNAEVNGYGGGWGAG